MSSWSTAFNWVMDNEDRGRNYASVPDAPGEYQLDANGNLVLDNHGHKIWQGAWAISGINSAAYPVQYQQINSLPQPARGPAIEGFYKTYFWSPFLDQVTSDEVGKRVFDAEVNMGQRVGVKCLQIALGFAPADCNGKWGPHTVSACNEAVEADLVAAFITARVQHYEDIIALKPADVKYKAVWEARAKK